MPLSCSGLLEFHSQYKLLLLAHSQPAYRHLGRLLATTNQQSLAANSELYYQQLLAALQCPATRGNHVNVLQHIAGYLKRALDSQQRHELNELIHAYRLAQIPLYVPIKTLQELFAHYPNAYINEQIYLQVYATPNES